METLIIKAGEVLPGMTAKHINSISGAPVRLDIDFGNPLESTLQPIATRTGVLQTQTFIVPGGPNKKKREK